jgi:hypothetical protein
VDAVCYNGEPNWLGWIVLGVGAWVIMNIALRIWIWNEDRKLSKIDRDEI